MSDTTDGRVPLAPGSREPSPAVSALTGFDPSRYRTGQRLIYASRLYRLVSLTEVEIGKVGRKWAEVLSVENKRVIGRVSLGEISLDGGGYTSPGKLYASQEDYSYSVERQAAWDGLRARVSRTYQCPSHLNLSDVIALAQGIAARSDETRSGSAEGKSPVRQDAPEEPHP